MSSIRARSAWCTGSSSAASIYCAASARRVRGVGGGSIIYNFLFEMAYVPYFQRLPASTKAGHPASKSPTLPREREVFFHGLPATTRSTTPMAPRLPWNRSPESKVGAPPLTHSEQNPSLRPRAPRPARRVERRVCQNHRQTNHPR